MTFPKLKGKAVLAPMAGVSDVAFRALCRKYGASLAYTEFVSGTAIVRGNVKSLDMLKTDPIEKPSAVQLFGNSVEDVVEAAKQIENRFNRKSEFKNHYHYQIEMYHYEKEEI